MDRPTIAPLGSPAPACRVVGAFTFTLALALLAGCGPSTLGSGEPEAPTSGSAMFRAGPAHTGVFETGEDAPWELEGPWVAREAVATEGLSTVLARNELGLAAPRSP